MRYNKVFKNVGASILPQIVNIVSNLLLPTMIIALYGSSTNGLVSTIKQVIAYVSLIGAGIATATTQALYEPVARQDIPVIRGMLKATDKMFRRCGYLYLAITIIIAFLYPLVVIGDVNYMTMVLLLVVMSISGASEFFIVGRCRALLYANQKVYVCTVIQAASLFLSLVCALIMLKLKCSIILVELAISLVYVFRAVGLYYYVKKNYAECFDIKDVQPINKAVAKKNDAMLHQLTGLAVTNSQAIILSSFVGLEAASVYAVYNIVFSGLLSICSNITTAVTPFIGRTIALNDRQRLLDKFNIMEFFFNDIATWIFAVSAVMIMPFIYVYTKGADYNYLYYSFAMLFIATTAFNVLRMPGQAAITAKGHFKETRVRAIIEATSCVILNIVFTLIFGLNGVLLGTCCALGWRCVDIITYANKHIIEQPNVGSIARLIKTVIIIAVTYLIGTLLNISVSGYWEWIKWSVIISFISLALIIIENIIFERKTLQLVRHFIFEGKHNESLE